MITEAEKRVLHSLPNLVYWDWILVTSSALRDANESHCLWNLTFISYRKHISCNLKIWIFGSVRKEANNKTSLLLNWWCVCTWAYSVQFCFCTLRSTSPSFWSRVQLCWEVPTDFSFFFFLILVWLKVLVS